MRRTKLGIVLIVLILITSACSNAPESKPNAVNEQGKIVVYTTIYPMYDFAKKIGGDKIDLRLMVPPGAEPHDWEPSAKMMGQIEKADVLIYNGAGMETWIDRIIGSIDDKKLIIVEGARGIDLLQFDEENNVEDDHGDEHGKYDPHVWLDPIRAIKMGENIKNAFVEADEKNADFYENNFNEFKSNLEKLDNEYKTALENRKVNQIVVSHASFGYLADRYGLDQVSVSGITPKEEPSPAKLADISELVKKYDIRYIFFETLTSPKMAQVLAKETGAKTEVLNPMGGLTEAEIKEGKEYFSVMKDNLKVLEKALK